MPRPLRIEYPDAWYHIMNRGRRSENIFSDEKDYILFTELLKETSEMWNIRIASYCLVPNHYHMLVQTPEANISRSMRHLNGVYTQRYNRRIIVMVSFFEGATSPFSSTRTAICCRRFDIFTGIPCVQDWWTRLMRINGAATKAIYP